MRKTYIYQPGQLSRKEAKRKGLKVVKTGKIGGMMILYIVKLGFTDLPIDKKISTAKKVTGKMAGNPNFPSPTVPLITVNAAIDALVQAQKAIPGGPKATSLRNTRVKELEYLMRQLQAYVENVAKGDPNIVLSSGMDVRDPKLPLGILAAPDWVNAKNAAEVGHVWLRWKTVKKRLYYHVEWSTDPNLPGEWPNSTVVSKSKALISGLTPGERYYFRIATCSSKGFFGYSKVVTLRVNLH